MNKNPSYKIKRFNKSIDYNKLEKGYTISELMKLYEWKDEFELSFRRKFELLYKLTNSNYH